MKAILVFCSAVAFAVAPFMVPFDGFDPTLYPVPQDSPPTQPAGYAFSIWGPIYLWLLASAAFGLFKRAEDPRWDAGRWPLFLSLAIGTAWLSVAQVSPVMATVLIWAMLGLALLALFRAPADDLPWLAAPVGLYAGWLTAASAVSIGLLAAGYGVLGGEAAAFAAIALGAVIALFVVRRTANPGYAAAVVWALVALVVRNGSENLGVATAAGLAALAITALYLQSRKRPKALHG
jgi:hypothetical protein